MYKLKYSNDNIYTGDISNTSDIKYVNVIDFDYSFVSDKSIISDYTSSTASVCFYKNKGTNIFSSGRYKEGTIEVLNETFYQCFDLNHNLDSTSGYKSSSSLLGASNISFHIDGDGGLKISFNDVYNTVNSIWVYVNHVTVYVKTNDNVLYERDFDDTTFEFSIHDKKLIINSETITTISGSFLPYNVFKYGSISNLKIESKYSMPMVFEGTGEVIDDIYGDVYCITRPAAGLGYLKSKANNILASSNIFAFDIACRIIGNSIPFSISESATFGESGFTMSGAGVWVHFDTTSSGFNSNIVTSSGIVTISGSVSSLNDYYLIRCYYDGSKFGTIVNGVETYTNCDNVTISGSNLNIITNNLLNIDSFAFYIDTLPTQGLYDSCLTKLNTAVSRTALVNSNDNSKFLFAADNFYPKNYLYSGGFEAFGGIPISYTDNLFYTQYSLAGGEVFLFSDNFYVSRLPFTEAEYNCFINENDKTFLTYFSGITVPANKIIAESFTNYNYVSDDFITTNSGLHIRNYSKVFNPVSSASVIEFSDVGWTDFLDIGVLLETDSIPAFPNESCVAVTGSGCLYIGTTTTSGLNINGNTSIYFYLDNLSVVVSGSNTGVLGSGIVVGSYDYVRYFIRNNATEFATINNIYLSTTQREVDTLTNKFFSYELPEYYNLDDSYTELFHNIGSSVSSNGITVYDRNFYDHQCSFSSYYDTTFSGVFNVFGYNFLGINDIFENGFITERWRLVCDPYGVYSCNQPGPINLSADSQCVSCVPTRMYDGNLLISVHSSTTYVIPVGNQYTLCFTGDNVLVDTVSIYVISYFINPEDGFVISCDIEYRQGSTWYMLLDNYVSPTISGVEYVCLPSERATWNPNDKSSQISLFDGNLKATNNSSGYHNVRANMCNSRYKWYWEITIVDRTTSGEFKVGIADSDANLDSQFARGNIHGYAYTADGAKQHNNNVGYGDMYTTGDIIGTALDLETGKIWWSKNGVWQAGGIPASGINEAFDGISGRWYPAHAFYNTGGCCIANFGDSSFIYPVPDGFNVGVYSCVSDWPIRHDIAVPIGRYDDIRITANSNWGQVVPTEIRPSCLYNYGGTAVCTISGNTCVHVALDDVLHVYSEYVLEDFFNSLSFSGINYYPFNSKLHLKDYSGEECYVKTNWTSSGTCDIIVSSETGSICTTVSGIYDSFIYIFCVSRNLDIIDLTGSIIGGSNGDVHSNYSYSSDDLGLDLVFYNKNIPNSVGSGCLFGFGADDYTVNFSSIAAGYKYTALDETDNITKTGVGFNTYPPNLLVDKSKGSYVDQSHTPCMELTSSGFQLITNIVDNNIDINVGTKNVGGIQQVSKFNRLSFFSDYVFMPTIFYRAYVIGSDKNYTSFSDIASLVQTGDKVYFYPGSYTITTDKQITIIGVANPTEVQLSINNASSGLTIMGCTTTKIRGSNVFNLYNCYILPWDYNKTTVILYDVININFYNCDLYNYSNMCYGSSYVLLHKCTTYRAVFYSVLFGHFNIYDEGYSTRGYYGYGPEFNRASIISGLSHVDDIVVSSFYYNSIYNHFPLHNQLLVDEDGCGQLISSGDSYSVYFYGDIKKLNSFSMYLFIQDLDGKIEIENSSSFTFTVDSNNLSVGIHLIMSIYGAEINMSVPISHSNVFKLSIVAVVFDGGSISIYLNGAKLATKYIIVTDFNDVSSYLDDSILFFDDTKFTCDGNGLLLKGASLKERVDFLVGTHVEELDSGRSNTIKINMEFSTSPIFSEYHNNTGNYYGYTAYNAGVGLYFNESKYEYEHIYFNANKSYKVYQNTARKYIGIYKVKDKYGNCVNESITTYISPLKNGSVTFGPAKIDNKQLGYCDIIDPYGYVSLYLSLPLPAIERQDYCFDIDNSVAMFCFGGVSPNYVVDKSSNSFTVNNSAWINNFTENGIFHGATQLCHISYFYINHDSKLNLNKNFTIELLFEFFNECSTIGTIISKGMFVYNIAYCVGINSRNIPYFKWSWEGDNILYANKTIKPGMLVYFVVVVEIDTVTFYINGEESGKHYTNKLVIVNNDEMLYLAYGYSGYTGNERHIIFEELCLLDSVKTKNEIINTWNTIGGGDNAPWIKINNVVVISNDPIKVSPSDRFIEKDGLIDTSKWEYTAYRPLDSSDGLVLDSRTAKKLKSKIVSYNVIFDVSVFCEFLEYSINRNWSVTFKYKFVSGNYIAVVIDYVKYDDIYVKCEYYYNGYKNSTSKIRLSLSPCGIRFVTDYDKYTYVQIGDRSYWHTLWTSTQNLFLETSGRLEVTLNNDDWDSWFILKITDFLPRLYCDSIANGETVDFYDAIPYGRAFYNQIPENVAMLCLSNDIFEIDASSSCIHSLEFINGQMQDLHVLNTTNRIFDNVNYEVFNIELLVYLTYDDTSILDLFPWININVKDKYLYVTMHDNDRTITDSINEFLNDYIYIAVSIGNPYTTLYINDQKFIYDTNFSDTLPYHFYPIGKNFSGRVVYFCGYYGDFDISGYNFRVATLSRYIGFDVCARKVFGDNIVTSLDPYSVIYTYDNPTYSSMLASKSCSLGYGSNIDVEILYDPAVLQPSVSSSVIIRCKYSSLSGKKTTSITATAIKYNVSHNYHESFGHVGSSQDIFSYDLSGTCCNNDSIFILDIDESILEDVLKGITLLNVKNNETNSIINIYIYLNSEFSINDIYGSSLLV